MKKCYIFEAQSTPHFWKYKIIINQNATLTCEFPYSSKSNAIRAAVDIASKFDLILNIIEV